MNFSFSTFSRAKKGWKKASVYAIESDEEEKISVVRVQAVKDKAVFAKMLVKQEPVRFQIDYGASANIFPYKCVPGVDLTLCSQSLVMWNGAKVKPVGAGALPATSFPGRREPGTRLSWERFNVGSDDETKNECGLIKIYAFSERKRCFKIYPD